jgi:hypothetical protein
MEAWRTLYYTYLTPTRSDSTGGLGRGWGGGGVPCLSLLSFTHARRFSLQLPAGRVAGDLLGNRKEERDKQGPPPSLSLPTSWLM